MVDTVIARDAVAVLYGSTRRRSFVAGENVTLSVSAGEFVVFVKPPPGAVFGDLHGCWSHAEWGMRLADGAASEGGAAPQAALGCPTLPSRPGPRTTPYCDHVDVMG